MLSEIECNLIKANIRNIVENNEEKDLALICGVLDTKINYKHSSKYAFGLKVIGFLKRDEVSDIVFLGLIDDILCFKVIIEQIRIDVEYGSGRYMGD